MPATYRAAIRTGLPTHRVVKRPADTKTPVAAIAAAPRDRPKAGPGGPAFGEREGFACLGAMSWRCQTETPWERRNATGSTSEP